MLVLASPPRNEAYDAQDMASRFLNIPEVKENMHARRDTVYEACSKEVDEIMGHDVMKVRAVAMC